MRDRWDVVRNVECACYAARGARCGGGRPDTYGYSLPHERLQAEERAAVKISQKAKEAAEKLAASDLRMAELRAEAERSAKLQHSLEEELALQREATAAAHEAASELLTRLPRAEFARLQREEGDAIASFGFNAAELLRIEERVNERAMRGVNVATDGDDAGERASIEQAQELLALRRKSEVACEALEAHEAELLRAVLDGVIAEVERREERVQQAADVVTQGSSLRDELREATEAAEAAARREEEAARRADALQLKMVEQRSQAMAAELL